MFQFYMENTPISTKQSYLETVDSCINQLLSITHFFRSFEDSFEVRKAFLDISKTFHKVWHADLHYKLRKNNITGNILNILTDFLKDRKQRVVLNGHSSWAEILR